MNLVISGQTVALQWNGLATTVAEAAAMLAPKYNVFRFSDPLQGDVLKVTSGAREWTVPTEAWLIKGRDGLPGVVTDKQLSADLRRLVA